MLPLLNLDPAPEEPRVLHEADFLAQAAVWPMSDRINPRAWLNNFRDDEVPYALDLLRSFVYFSEGMSEVLLRSAVQRLGQEVLDFNAAPHVVASAWRGFVDGLVVVPVRGEDPNPTDSGFAYVRSARNALGLNQSQFHEERDALQLLQSVHHAGVRRDVVFVDDFVGSGNQFVTTWQQEVPLAGGGELSFDRIASATASRFFYCPLVATEAGAEAIARYCPGVTLSPAHFLPAEYSAFHPESRLWARERRSTGPEVLRRIAERVGMPDTDGDDVDDWKGFHELGLAIAIRDSIPDANLGVFRWASSDWTPLFNSSVGS